MPPRSLTEPFPAPDFLPDVLERLRQHYLHQHYLPSLPAPRRFPEPLDGVVRVILAQQNTRRVASRQWETLKTVYPQWEAALADGPDGIEATLRQAGGGLTRMKADYLYGVLNALAESRGELSLRFLHELSDAEIRTTLENLPGVGMKTTSLVMLFDLLRPAIPVDSNIERWTKRMELVPANWNANKVEQWFDQAVPRDWETRYALHLSGVHHGQETCKTQKPHCETCVLRQWCPSAALFLLAE